MRRNLIYLLALCSIILLGSCTIKQKCQDEGSIGVYNEVEKYYCHEGYWEECNDDGDQINDYCCNGESWNKCSESAQNIIVVPPSCENEGEISHNQRFICDKDLNAIECSDANSGQSIRIFDFYPYTCIQNKWTYPCDANEIGVLMTPTTLHGKQDSWTICDGQQWLQCNEDTKGVVVKNPNNAYVCSLDSGWTSADGYSGSDSSIDVDDEDHDGVLDHDPQGGQSFDHEPESASSCEVYSYDNYPSIDKLGAQVDPSCKSECIPMAGATGGTDGPLNLNIILLSCNYDQRTRKVFDRVTGIITDAMVNRIEPYKSNTDKFRITALYADRLKVGKSNPSIQALDLCQNDKTIRDVASDCIDNFENTAIVVYGHNVEDLGNGFVKLGECGFTYENGIYNPICLLNINPNHLTGLVRTTLHELGHGFRFGHPFKDFDTGRIRNEELYYYDPNQDSDNDFYTPDIPLDLFEDKNNFDVNVPCPMWDGSVAGEEFSRWVFSDTDKIGCFQYYEGYKNLFTPKDNYDLMAYESGNYQEYNPVDRKLVNDLLNADGGYQRYMEINYPNRCSEITQEFLTTLDQPSSISLESIKDMCLIKECSYIPTEYIDPDYNQKMHIITGIASEMSRQACCSQISDQGMKSTCINQ